MSTRDTSTRSPAQREAETTTRSDEPTVVPSAEEFEQIQLAQEQKEGLGKRIWKRVAPPIVQDVVEEVKDEVADTRARRQAERAQAGQPETPEAAPVVTPAPAPAQILNLSDPAQALAIQQNIKSYFGSDPSKLGVELKANPDLLTALKISSSDAARMSEAALGTLALSKFNPDGDFGPMSQALLTAYNTSISRAPVATNVPAAAQAATPTAATATTAATRDAEYGHEHAEDLREFAGKTFHRVSGTDGPESIKITKQDVDLASMVAPSNGVTEEQIQAARDKIGSVMGDNYSDKTKRQYDAMLADARAASFETIEALKSAAVRQAESDIRGAIPDARRGLGLPGAYPENSEIMDAPAPNIPGMPNYPGATPAPGGGGRSTGGGASRPNQQPVQPGEDLTVSGGRVQLAAYEGGRPVANANLVQMEGMRDTAGRPVVLRTDAAFMAEKMIADAASQGVNLSVTSSFRTQEKQQELYDNRHNNRYPVAPPGYSKHQSGRALDFTNDSRALGWLQQNAEKYGFVTIARDPIHWEYRGATADELGIVVA
jgi:hypothetical protein